MLNTVYRVYPLVGLYTAEGEINTAIFSMMADFGIEGDAAECLYVLFVRSTDGNATIFRVAQNATVRAEIDKANRAVVLALSYRKYGNRNPLHKLPWLTVRPSTSRSGAIDVAFVYRDPTTSVN